jgi:hypothetical protein
MEANQGGAATMYPELAKKILRAVNGVKTGAAK